MVIENNINTAGKINKKGVIFLGKDPNFLGDMRVHRGIFCNPGGGYSLTIGSLL